MTERGRAESVKSLIARVARAGSLVGEFPCRFAAIVGIGALLFPAPAGAQSTIVIDGKAKGPTFGGVGALSAGGNSRLLYDYPEEQRSQILDYVFKPKVGASLQILKVEIGGNTQSTDGAESSHEAKRGVIDCSTGYEWWLMAEAKARNPKIKLYGLAWGVPGWVGGSFWSSATTGYLLDWLQCAASHGLTIDYLGGWNERGYDITWYKGLRAALDQSAFSAVQIVGADSFDWSIADDMAADPDLAKTVDVLGIHYPCGGDQSNAWDCSGTSANAIASGKQLWASEGGSQDYNAGSAAMACAINRGYFEGQLTGFLNWPVVASIYENLPFSTVGLLSAPSPWSGAYRVGSETWVAAQYTQFTEPGWKFIGPGGSVAAGGTYIALRDPASTDYSVVLETTTASAAQPVFFNVSGGLYSGTVHVWGTKVGSLDSSTWFKREPDITPSVGAYSFNAQPGYVYSFSTTGGQSKSNAKGLPRAPLALPYEDSFDSYDVGGMAKYLSNMQGDFQVQNCSGGRAGKCIMQMEDTRPIEWNPDTNPYALFGDLGWQNYAVSVDAYLPEAGSIQVFGRVGVTFPFNAFAVDAYIFQVSDTGDWYISTTSSGESSATPAGATLLKSGKIAAFGTKTWHTLQLSFQGSHIAASVDGKEVGSADDSSHASGQVGIALGGYQTSQFDNLSIKPNTPAPLYQIANPSDGLCLSVAGGSTDPGGGIEQAVCGCGAEQQWYVQGNLVINSKSGLALDVPSIGPLWPAPGSKSEHVWGPSAPGVQLDQQPANGSPNQLFVVKDAGTASNGKLVTLVSEGSGLAIAVAAQSSAPGAAVVQMDSNAAPAATWAFVDPPPKCTDVPDAGVDAAGGSEDSGNPADSGSPNGFAGSAGSAGATNSGGSGGVAIGQTAPVAPSSKGGCGCRTAPTRGTPATPWLLASALFVLSANRRRRWRARG